MEKSLQSEKYVEKYLVKRCSELGFLTVKVPATSTGFPDRLVIARQTTLYIEVKGHGGRVSKAQEIWKARLEELQHPVFTVWSTQDVDLALSTI